MRAEGGDVTCRRCWASTATFNASARAESRCRADPKAVEAAAKTSMVSQIQAMLDFHAEGIPTFDYGNNRTCRSSSAQIRTQ
jgi:urocanate hydratase